jgi:hypothetical protein
VQQRAEEHDHRSSPPSRLDIHRVQLELVRPNQLQVIAVVEPTRLYADAGQHLEDPVDLLDSGDATEDRPTPVQQAGAQQPDSGVL